MAQNSTNLINFSRTESITKLSEKREPKYNRPHCIIPTEDLTWVINQAKTIQNLWNECWKSDPFGSRWVKLTTSLSDRAFRLARKALYTAGLFEFKPDKDISDTRKTTGWLVINLHGARRIAEFWSKEAVAENVPSISSVVPISGESLPICGESLPISGESVPPICSETLANTGVLDSLSNSSLSFQEHLKDVTEKDIEILAPPEPLGGVPAASGDEWISEGIKEFKAKGSKLGDFMAHKLENVINRIQGKETEAGMGFYRDEFKLKYRWDIPDANLQQFYDLGQDLRTAFLDRFKQLYAAYGGGLYRCSICFSQAMKCVTRHAQELTASVKNMREKQTAYWEYVMTRREELVNTQPAN